MRMFALPWVLGWMKKPTLVLHQAEHTLKTCEKWWNATVQGWWCSYDKCRCCKESILLCEERWKQQISEQGKLPDLTRFDKFCHNTNLSFQSPLGEFVKEGLRTLVLDMRILSEDGCSEWLAKCKRAVSSIQNREEKLTEAVLDIKKELHLLVLRLLKTSFKMEFLMLLQWWDKPELNCGY